MTAALATGALTGAATAIDELPATKYAVVKLESAQISGILGDFNPSAPGTQDPNPDIQGTMGINNHGEVVFAYEDNGVLRAFVWLPSPNHLIDGCGLFDLNNLAGQSASERSIARDINDAGQIVGQFGGTDAWQRANQGGQAIVWDLGASGSGGVTIDHTLLPINVAPQPGGFVPWSGAHAINNDPNPVIVGASGVSRPCVCELTEGSSVDQIVAFDFRLGVDDPLLFLNELDSVSGGQAEARDVTPSPDAMTDPDAVGRSLCEWNVTFPNSASGGPPVCEEVLCGLDIEGTVWRGTAQWCHRASK